MVTLPNSKLNFPKTFHIPKLVGFSPKILLLKTALLISNDMKNLNNLNKIVQHCNQSCKAMVSV